MSLVDRLRQQDILLSRVSIEKLERLVSELLRWNQRHNLTAILSKEDVYEKHLIDSLTLLPFVQQKGRLLDIGSGAGFPGLPLKIACPALTVVAIEAVAKKVHFQRQVVRQLGLLGYSAVHGRAEVLGSETEYHHGFDLVTARALADLPRLAALARPFLAADGCLIAMKGPDVDGELAEFGPVLRSAGWTIQCHELTLSFSGAVRCLVEMRNKTD